MLTSVNIPARPDAVAMAREVVTQAVGTVRAVERTIEDLRLLTSELVTNALLHAGLQEGGSIAVLVQLSQDRVRVEIGDYGPGFEPTEPETASVDRIGGWGLLLVEKLADRWGVIRNDPNLVWFELIL